MIYATLGSGLARTICHIAHGSDCSEVVHAIQVGLSFAYAASPSYSGAVPVKRDASIHASYLQWTKDTIAGSQLSFDRIVSVPLDTEEAALVKRDGGPSILSRVHLSGVSLPGQGSKQNVIANLFEDGNIVLHLPMGDVSNGTNLAKPFNGAGFKISYTTRIKTRLTARHQEEMARFLAANWASEADFTQMNELIGFASTLRRANFYYRIIPERYGFGLNYESVDICGGMAGYL